MEKFWKVMGFEKYKRGGTLKNIPSSQFQILAMNRYCPASIQELLITSGVLRPYVTTVILIWKMSVNVKKRRF